MTKLASALGPAARTAATSIARATRVALVRGWPAALVATRAGIRGTTNAVQALPISAVQALAAGSAGLGAGLYLGGAPRLVAAAGIAPGLVLGAAALSRPAPMVVPNPGEPGADATPDQSRFDDDGGPVGASRVR